MEDDVVIMSRISAGELKLLEELFQRHHGPLFRYFLGRTNDRPSSEDGVQETFHRVLRYRKTFRGEGSFTAWLYGIARNVHLDQRARSKDAVSLQQMSDLPGDVHEARRRESRITLHWALEQLEDTDRELVILSRVDELSMIELAAILGCTVGAAKVRIHRAVKRLREVCLEREKTRSE